MGNWFCRTRLHSLWPTYRMLLKLTQSLSKQTKYQNIKLNLRFLLTIWLSFVEVQGRVQKVTSMGFCRVQSCSVRMECILGSAREVLTILEHHNNDLRVRMSGFLMKSVDEVDWKCLQITDMIAGIQKKASHSN